LKYNELKRGLCQAWQSGFAKSSAVQGLFWAMGSNVCFVVLMVLNRMFRNYLPVTVIMWGRSMAAFLLILPFVKWNRMSQLWWVQLMRGVLISGAIFCSYNAYRHLPVHIAILIGATSPIFTMLMARFFLHERIDRKRWIVFAIGCSGVVILCHNFMKESWNFFIFLAFFGNFLAGSISIVSRWLALRQICPQSLIAYGLVAPCVVFSALVFMDPGVVFLDLKPFQWGFLALLGGIGALSQYATFRALMVAKASFVAPLEYTRLCFMIPAGYIFLGEVPTLGSYIGGALIVMASVRLFVWEMRKV
jgi:drug/metabolite transporter (DMT)-like permease